MGTTLLADQILAQLCHMLGTSFSPRLLLGHFPLLGDSRLPLFGDIVSRCCSNAARLHTFTSVGPLPLVRYVALDALAHFLARRASRSEVCATMCSHYILCILYDSARTDRRTIDAGNLPKAPRAQCTFLWTRFNVCRPAAPHSRCLQRGRIGLRLTLPMTALQAASAALRQARWRPAWSSQLQGAHGVRRGSS